MVAIDSGTFAIDAYDPFGPNPFSLRNASFGLSANDTVTSDVASVSADYTVINAGGTATFRIDTNQSFNLNPNVLSGYVHAQNVLSDPITFTLLEAASYNFTGEFSSVFAEPMSVDLALYAYIDHVSSGTRLYQEIDQFDSVSSGETHMLDGVSHLYPGTSPSPAIGSRTGVLNPGTYEFYYVLGSGASWDDNGPLEPTPVSTQGFVELQLQSQASSVPEPSSIALFGLGLVGLLAFGLLRKRSLTGPAIKA